MKQLEILDVSMSNHQPDMQLGHFVCVCVCVCFLPIHDIKKSGVEWIGGEHGWFGDPRTVLYRFKPLYRRVQ